MCVVGVFGGFLTSRKTVSLTTYTSRYTDEGETAPRNASEHYTSCTMIKKFITARNWWLGKVVKPPYKHVVQVGDPVLKCRANEVDLSQIHAEDFKQLLKHMRYVVKSFKCAGLSAPQIGVNLRVFVMSFPPVSEFRGSWKEYQLKEMAPIPYTVYINPKLKVLDYNKVVFSEVCESMRGFAAEVPRYKKILLSGLNEEGNSFAQEMYGWPARIAQHEMDHLNGKMFLDIMQPNTLMCTIWDRINREGGNIYMLYSPRKIFPRW